MSDLYQPPGDDTNATDPSPSRGDSVERALAGDFDFDPLEVLKQAWQLTDGVKLILLVGMFAVAIGSIVAQAVVGFVASGPLMAGLLGTLLQLIVVGPIYGGMLIVALRQATGQRIAMDDLWSQFSKAAPIIFVIVLSNLLVITGFILLILPGIYLSVAYVLALPLVVDRGMAPWQALETSRKVITKCWWRMAFTWLLCVLIIIVGALPLLIPLIWILPMVVLVIAVVYRNLFGVASSA